jgi:hypothetical protein
MTKGQRDRWQVKAAVQEFGSAASAKPMGPRASRGPPILSHKLRGEASELACSQRLGEICLR